MTSFGTTSITMRIARLAAACVLLVGLSASVGQTPVPANASAPAALELAEHALTTNALLEDEGSYRLIDPVGPGGVTRSQAVGEVLASTMQGGMYNRNHPYSGAYGQKYYIPAQQQAPHPAHPPVGGWPQ